MGNRTDEITEDGIGTGAGLFEVRKIGDEYFTFIEQCKDPTACTILLRGATEMEIAHLLTQKAKTLKGVIQWPYKAVAGALEIIPRTLAQNCGANTIRSLTALRAKHAKEEDKNVNWGINGETGELADMSLLGIWEPLSVKLQVYKTAIETAI